MLFINSWNVEGEFVRKNGMKKTHSGHHVCRKLFQGCHPHEPKFGDTLNEDPTWRKNENHEAYPEAHQQQKLETYP